MLPYVVLCSPQVLVDPAALMHVLGTKMDYVEDRLK